MRPGLFAARTLLSSSDGFAAIRFINMSGIEQVLKRDLCLGDAVPNFDGDQSSGMPTNDAAVPSNASPGFTGGPFYEQPTEPPANNVAVPSNASPGFTGGPFYEHSTESSTNNVAVPSNALPGFTGGPFHEQTGLGGIGRGPVAEAPIPVTKTGS